MKTFFFFSKIEAAAPGARAFIVNSDHLQFPFFFCSGPKPLLIWLSERPAGKKGFTGNGNMSRGLVHTTVFVPTRAVSGARVQIRSHENNMLTRISVLFC